MKTSRDSLLLVSVLSLCACGGEGGGATSAASSSPSHAASSAPAQAASAPAKTASAPTAASTSSAKAPSAETRTTLVKHLTEGRKLSKKKDFKAAIVELDKALAVAPKDPRVLAEIGWAAFNAGDLDRAKDANKRALATTSEPKLRAQILYNTGRVAEEQKDTDAAKRAYGDSLVLRDNAEVKKRFEGVGGKPEEVARLWSICAEGFGSTDDLCGCLVKKAGDFVSLDGGNATCEMAKDAPNLGDSRLSIARVKNETGSSTVSMLVAKDGNKYRAVAQLGEDFEPGAFGVHNELQLKPGELKKVKGKSVAIVKSLQTNADFNMAGLELCTYNLEQHTICILGDDKSPTVCPRTVPVSVEAGCEQGVEIDPKDMDAETKAMIDEMKANWKKSSGKLSYSIDDDGKLVVKLAEGDASLFSKNDTGEFSLLSLVK
ncbi:MAG: tetratricopeptide repeat protein [Polyangiaceae bacterium]|nr:tetratricopeptide repeat protein [Polyangiaceae bacterium]